MPQESKLNQLIMQQINVERAHIEGLMALRKKVGIAAARLLLLEMLLDSQKHVAILNEMLEILKEIRPEKFLWEHEVEELIDETLLKREFEDHIKKEHTVLDQLKEELEHTKDEGLKLLFKNIEEDEKKHHKLTQTLVNNLYKID